MYLKPLLSFVDSRLRTSLQSTLVISFEGFAFFVSLKMEKQILIKIRNEGYYWIFPNLYDFLSVFFND